MDERTRHILEAAIELAENGGFEATRMRDVAAHAGVALGTFYKRFQSKEDLLVAALDHEFSLLEKRVGQMRVTGDTPIDKMMYFFTTLTKAFTRKPNLAKAALRALSSGNPDLAEKVSRFHDRTTAMVVAILKASEAELHVENLSPDNNPERTLAIVLQQVWFASLVGWMGGLHPIEEVIKHVRDTAELLLATANAKKV